jgi:hypothetical protein
MKSVCVCFGLEALPAGMTPPDIEQDYLDVYKPAVQFLYSHPSFCMEFSFTGPQLRFYRKNHPEFIEILEQLINRKQIEVLGGGFYNPVFPLLYPMDRSGQIEMLSAEIRQSVGKRPRGLCVCAGSWDSSLVTSFETCGMEYVMLDSTLIPPSKQSYIPIIMSDRGKAIDIIPVYRSLKPDGSVTAEEYLASLLASVKKCVKGDQYERTLSERYADVIFAHEEFRSLLKSGYLQDMCDTAAQKFAETIRFSYPLSYRKTVPERVNAFINAGMSGDIAQWAKIPYTSVTKSDCYPVTIYDFFQTYPQSRALYDRMMYVSMLVNQCHGDKMRKKEAREKLWAAQSGESYVCTAKGSLVNSLYRQKAYSYLAEAESLVRSCSGFEESVSSFDYNSDGSPEYVCRMNDYTACITAMGGEISELDVMQSTCNYADNPSRIEEFDGCNDNYYRGLFIDHIFTDEDMENYLVKKPAGSGIFSQVKYEEQKFSSQHNEITLCAKAEFSEKKQMIRLRKKYIANSSGFTVQYILRNDSGEPLHANFAVESNFTQTNFTTSDFNPYRVEIAAAAKKKEIDTTNSSREITSSGRISDVSAVQITDTDNSLSFVYEPNESCGFGFAPITFRRPEYEGTKIVPSAMTFAAAMFWNVQLDPGMEMEKTVNFSILVTHRKSVKKTDKKKQPSA